MSTGAGRRGKSSAAGRRGKDSPARRRGENSAAGGGGAGYALPNSNPMRVVLLTLLFFEVVVFGLAVPVMILVSHVPAATAIAAGGVAALLALVAAGLLRKPIGYLVGWIAQPVGILLGLFTPAMYAIGAIFAGLWLLTFILGRRLDAQAAARAS